MSDISETLSNLLSESRRFFPPVELAINANVKIESYQEASEDRLAFWAKQAKRLQWDKPWTQVLDWSDAPFARWFVDGRLNIAVNCVDRHVAAGNGSRVAYYWEGEPGDTRVITYADLHREVAKAANALESLGVAAGDRVAIYMPMIPEAVFSLLACARIGAVHTVIFSGFSASAIADRVNDTGAKLLITADGGWRRGKVIERKANVDKALEGTPSVQSVIVVKRCGNPINMVEGRDVWWKDAWVGAPNTHKAKAFDAEFIELARSVYIRNDERAGGDA